MGDDQSEDMYTALLEDFLQYAWAIIANAGGGDWTKDQIVGAAFIASRGGRVVRIPFVRGRSTSRLVARMRRRTRA